MEEEIALLVNDLAKSTGKPTYIVIIESVIHILACVLGFLSNIFIIYAILRSKKINFRVNLLILNWTICNTIFLVVSLILYANHYIKILEHWGLCFLLITDIVMQSILIIFSIILVSDNLIKSKQVNIKLLIVLIYIFIISIWLAMMYTCLSKYFENVIYTFYINTFAFLFLTLTIIYKHIWNFATRKTASISKDSEFRLGFVSIFVFLTAVAVIFIIFVNRFSEYFESGISIAYLSSVFMLIYLIRNDVVFKIRFVEFCKCNREDQVSSAINFVDDNSDDDASIRFLNESRTDEDVFVV